MIPEVVDSSKEISALKSDFLSVCRLRWFKISETQEQEFQKFIESMMAAYEDDGADNEPHQP